MGQRNFLKFRNLRNVVSRGKNNDLKLSANKNYSTALVSSLYDIKINMPINYGIFKSFNEREALNEQFEYFKENDVAIMDR